MLLFFHIGRFLLLLRKAFSKPENYRIIIKRTFAEMVTIGVESLGIIAMISIFMGMVTTLQTAYQLVSGLIADSVIGMIVTDSTILELSTTISSLVLAGRVGSNISSEIGNMKISEQIDALEVMGINSANYLIFPKILASLIVFPLLVIISITLSIGGGIMVGDLTGAVSASDFIQGAQSTFRTFTLVYAMIKTISFAFVISSISSYQGYFVTGGALEVGRASTKAVVQSCIFILLFDYLLAQLLL
jgi:phospholipid/cholesterol/gamma-HCH transport system permease protein